ncbi:type IV pilus modification PilV family protein [Nitrospina watsonii]|uniref:Type II secretion system protein n=1 Tax=Nitrospina watsonii TaxID=1323948 RepID=A0ABN8W2C3_9BACT|nr:hypothetical protein [Nitrospina watsonii]CAI2718830.1 putative Type II secretion system protein [Nitrospina watsonii]
MKPIPIAMHLKRTVRDKFLNNEQGFSLIDILLAIALLSFGLLAYGAFMGSTVDRNSSNEWGSIAATIAEERIEALRTKAQSTVINNADDETDTPVVVSKVTFNRTTDVVNGAAGNLTDITVTVTWTDNLPSTYTVSTRLHQQP